MTMLERVRIPHLNRTGVIYRPLEGRTLRHVADAGELDKVLAEKLGGFFAYLHKRGIVFRAIHFGNILLCPDGTFGLIDISDMDVFARSLNMKGRLRNFHHLFRYDDDLARFPDNGVRNFLEGYLAEQDSPALRRRFEDEFQRWMTS